MMIKSSGRFKLDVYDTPDGPIVAVIEWSEDKVHVIQSDTYVNHVQWLEGGPFPD